MFTFKAPYRAMDQRRVLLSVKAAFHDGRTIKSITFVVDEDLMPIATTWRTPSPSTRRLRATPMICPPRFRPTEPHVGQSVLEKLVAGANGSAQWYEHFAEHMKLKPVDHAMGYLTRSGRVDPGACASCRRASSSAMRRRPRRGGAYFAHSRATGNPEPQSQCRSIVALVPAFAGTNG